MLALVRAGRRDRRRGQGEDWEIEDGESPCPRSTWRAWSARQLFWKAFRGLRARDREILALRHFQELSYQQIAEALEIPRAR